MRNVAEIASITPLSLENRRCLDQATNEVVLWAVLRANKMVSRTGHQTPRSANTEGSFGQSYHLEMLHDDRRVDVIMRAISACSRQGSSFLELGCGTGVFTRFASGYFDSCFAYEKDPVVFAVAKETLSNLPTCNVGLLNEDVLSTKESNQTFDVILFEMLSTWLIVEPQIPVYQHALKVFSHRNTIFIPNRVVNIACLSYFDYDRFGVSLRAPFIEFSGRRRAEPMSVSVVTNDFNFAAGANHASFEHMTGAFVLTAICDGDVNSVRLSNVIEFARSCLYSNGDALVPDVIIPLKKNLSVSAGDCIRIEYSYLPSKGFDHFIISAEKLDFG